MADQPPDPGSHEHTGGKLGTPRWVKVFGIIAIVVVLLIGLILVTGLGGPHGPQRHGAADDAGGHASHFTAQHDAGRAHRPAGLDEVAREVEVLIPRLER